ncbi:hypothetical protein CPLU01_07726 [Colletotrichum plurivorum]|uniref:Uncharacterized protein n=1 Tax=Colletotrichum plurivorum TaxID=2175906 RepID=A0A8H6KEF7_9PEZI|nr:hypothetical protein CPLU01_07726 [Colletotrichum plurivorum]
MDPGVDAWWARFLPDLATPRAAVLYVTNWNSKQWLQRRDATTFWPTAGQPARVPVIFNVLPSAFPPVADRRPSPPTQSTCASGAQSSNARRLQAQRARRPGFVVVVGGYAHRFQLHNTNHCPPNASQKARLCFPTMPKPACFLGTIYWPLPKLSNCALELQQTTRDAAARSSSSAQEPNPTSSKPPRPSSLLNEHPSTSRQNEPESATEGGIEALTRRPMCERGTVGHLFPSSPKPPPDLHGSMPN